MNGADHTAPSIAYRWVKANVYSAIVNAVLGILVYALGKALAVNQPDAGAITIAIFLVAAGVLTACGFAVYARLTAGVLARKLPHFPVRTWFVLHVLVGCAYGAFISLSMAMPDGAEEPLDIAWLVEALVVGAIVGAACGAAFGSLQVLVIRKAARRVTAWIAYSTLGGTMIGVVLFAATFLGPESGFVSELAGQFANVALAVVMAITLLPALRRLEPRPPG